MKKLIRIAIIPLMLALPLAGCNCSGGSISPELEELLSKVDNISEITYTLVISYSDTGEVVTMNVWLKVPDLRVDVELNGQETVFLADMEKETGYTYLPAGGIAVRTDFSDIPSSIKADIDEVRQYNPTIIGTETVDGKSCTVVTYRDGSTDVKAWIWNDYGIFIKRELSESGNTVLIELKDIDFSEIPDSVFELPEDALRSDWFETPAN
jgi:hypothetical protein